MNSLAQWLFQATGLSPELQSKLASSIITILTLWLIQRILIRVVWKKTEAVQLRYHWQKVSTYVVVTLGFLLVGRIWFAGIQSLATFLGLVTAGLAIALQDIVKSFAGWGFILWRRPFSVGDRIQVGANAGDVVDIRIFKFTMMEIGNWVHADQSTGRIIHLPNSYVLTEAISNYGQGFQFIWNEIPVLLTFESNWEKGKEILQEIATRHAAHLSSAAEKRLKEASKRYMIFYKTLTPTVYTSVQDCGVMLTIRYLIDPRQRRSSEQGIWEDILREFSKCENIDFAYPTQRFYDNVVEGKRDARAKSHPLPGNKDKFLREEN
ncbi:MAG: mechanosensitive ion channel family protein [Calditrichaeota bacterium]|nr:MAG: mechanosensitive ion channel family protein [Calditrichota bacterium]